MSYITLNKNNFFNNLDIIANQTKSKDKIALVLKDNAYGHGIKEIASMAYEYGIKKAVVRSDIEAKEVYDNFEYILVLASIPNKKDKKIHYTINDIKNIEKFPKGTKVELKVDTGMNRNGIEISEIEKAFELINRYDLSLKAIFTHHSSADELNGFYEIQKNNFNKVKILAKTLAKKYNINDLKYHSSNSASLFRDDKFKDDMARVGIASYGCLELPKPLKQPKLKPILSFYGEKISSRELKDGECVGYSATFKTDKKCFVTNYDVGYGDGFLRSCSNHYITPKGIKIAGRISMDNSSFLSNDNEILIFNDASYIAKYANTISYEILTSLKPNIKRVIVL